jgi:hypothetical protein
VLCKNSNAGTAPCRDTIGLLLNFDQTRCIFLVLDMMYLFRSRGFIPHGAAIGAIMDNGWQIREIFHLPSEAHVAGLYFRRTDNELWFY